MSMLTSINAKLQENALKYQMEYTKRMLSINYKTILENYNREKIPLAMDYLLTQYTTALSPFQGVLALRYYDDEGQEISHSHMMMGMVQSENNEIYYVLFDEVLTDFEMIEMAESAQKYATDLNHSLNFNHNAESAMYGELIGIIDNNCIYPQKLTYYYDNHSVSIMNSDNKMFSGAQCKTIRLAFSNIESPLFITSFSPNVISRYRSVNQSLDELLSTHCVSSHSFASTYIDGNYAGVGRYGDDSGLLGTAYNYNKIYSAAAGIKVYYIVSFLAAVFLSFILSLILYRHDRFFTERNN